MIAITTESAYGVMTGASRAATSPLSGRVRAGVNPLRSWAELCPQAPMAHVSLALVGDLIAGVRNDGPADESARTAATQKFGFDKQYGTTPHQSGTRVWKPPV
jgi:hypothetical protein